MTTGVRLTLWSSTHLAGAIEIAGNCKRLEVATCVVPHCYSTNNNIV